MMKQIVNITIEDREDGGLRVYSKELPGLILSGATKAKVLSAIEPAVRTLLAMKGQHVGDLQINAHLPTAERYRANVDRINRATDREIDAAARGARGEPQ
jgi:hypothetical protein